MVIAEDGENTFFFGLATAPAHVEDRLNDAWLQFAYLQRRQRMCEKTETQQDPKLADALMGPASGDGGAQQASSTPFYEAVKKKRPLKVAMEAMIRGFEKYVDNGEGEEANPNEECHHNVAAWHNVPHP